MPNLPLDHPEPFAATLGVMLYPGMDPKSRRRARAFTAQFLAEPLRRYHEEGNSLPYADLARIASDSGVPLGDIEKRWWDGTATGEIFKTLFALAHTDPTLASWGNATKLAELVATRSRTSGSRSSLYDGRRRYGSVAHLWSAWSIRGRRFYEERSVGYDYALDFQFFLAEAETLRRWWVDWERDRAGSEAPLANEVWRVPEGWAPPEEQPGWPPTGRIPELKVPDELLSHLRHAGRPRRKA